MAAWEVYTVYDSVTVGEAYGFQIGSSKKEVFDSMVGINEEFDFHSVWISYQEGMNSLVDIIPVDDLSYESVHLRKQWQVTIGSRSLLNSIRFTFDDEHLIEIYRHRQAVEFP